MKKLLIFLLVFSIYGCNNSSNQQHTVLINKPVDYPTKIKIVQTCLDSIVRQDHYNEYKIYKLILIKNNHYTIGLDSLHLGENKIHLEDLPKVLNIYLRQKIAWIFLFNFTTLIRIGLFVCRNKVISG
jgi:hypothetical protein